MLTAIFFVLCLLGAVGFRIIEQLNCLIRFARMREDRIEAREDRRRQDQIRSDLRQEFPLSG